MEGVVIADPGARDIQILSTSDRSVPKMTLSSLSLSSCRLLIAVCFFLFLFPPIAAAVLPPDEHNKMMQTYLSAVDIRGTAEFLHLGTDPQCKIKQMAAKNCECRVEYRIRRIDAAPVKLPINEGDQLTLAYPCDFSGRMTWIGSFLPWAELADNGSIQIQLRVEDLLQIRSRFWELDNERHLFSPVFPREVKPVKAK